MVEWQAFYSRIFIFLHLFWRSRNFMFRDRPVGCSCCALQVVIHEALMLLRDRCHDTGDDVTTTTSGSSRAAALRFIEAVSNTKSLTQPKHINATFDYQHRRCWPECIRTKVTMLQLLSVPRTRTELSDTCRAKTELDLWPVTVTLTHKVNYSWTLSTPTRVIMSVSSLKEHACT